MNERNPNATTSRKPVAAAIFWALSLLLFPVSLAGYLIWIGMGILMRNTSDVSSTAQGPLFARFLQHRLGIRPDEAADRLMMALPGVPRLGLYLSTWPLLIAHRLTGYVPRTFRYPYEGEVAMQDAAAARQSFFDAAVERSLADVAQLVILGAGYDTRAFRLPRGAWVRVFEVDQPQTQAVKREILAKAGVDASAVTFVSADFEKEDWLVRLVDAGFDPTRPALFLWEGVTLYLNRQAVESTLRKIAGTARGSVVAFDYFTTEPLESRALYWRYARVMTRAAGEPLTFGVDSTPPSRERLAELLRSCGLALGEQRTLGQETAGKRAWGGFATAVVQ